MNIDWINFTPVSALVGGGVLGLAAILLMALNGRIAGISGIGGGLLRAACGDRSWRAAFIIGLIASPLLYRLITPLPPIRIEAGWGQLIVAGLLVGLGTRYGSGCTSGHGVCGLARGSRRSLVATGCFMLTGFVSVYLLHHGL